MSLASSGSNEDSAENGRAVSMMPLSRQLMTTTQCRGARTPLESRGSKAGFRNPRDECEGFTRAELETRGDAGRSYVVIPNRLATSAAKIGRTHHRGLAAFLCSDVARRCSHLDTRGTLRLGIRTSGNRPEADAKKLSAAPIGRLVAAAPLSWRPSPGC